jgi:hypothetical protein
LRPVFDCLINLEKPDDTELLIITDGDVNLERAVDKRLDSVSFAKIQVVSYGEKPATTINERRFRISDIHNKAKHYVSGDCDYVFLVEDDTTYPKETLTKLFKSFKSVENCMYVEGVQLGRHGAAYVGAWLYDQDVFMSLMPGKGVEQISAGGFYCALTDAELYKMHHFEPFDKEGTNGLSCDVNYGIYLKQQGYECLIDWSIQTDHIGERGSVNLGNTMPEQLQFKKENDKWRCIRL